MIITCLISKIKSIYVMAAGMHQLNSVFLIWLYLYLKSYIWYFLHLTQSLKDITLALYIFSNEMINQDSNLQRKIIRKGKYSMTCNHVFDWTQNNSVVSQLVECSLHMWEIRVRSPWSYGQLNLLKQVDSDSSPAKHLAKGVRVTGPQNWP